MYNANGHTAVCILQRNTRHLILVTYIDRLFHVLSVALLHAFFTVLFDKKAQKQKDDGTISAIGVMLIILSILFHVMVIISIKNNTATLYGTIPMITIATYTFIKITMAIITAVKHKGNNTNLYKAVSAIRYSEVAVSLLAMQQSMLVSFEGADETSAVILNACTGAGVCFFVFALGVITLKNSRKETK